VKHGKGGGRANQRHEPEHDDGAGFAGKPFEPQADQAKQQC
jgi:hypothetical protein